MKNFLPLLGPHPEDPENLLFFRRFLAIKTGFLLGATTSFSWTGLLLVAAVIVAMTIATQGKYYRRGLVILLLLFAGRAVADLPYTLNHAAYEVFLLLLLTVLATNAPRDSTRAIELSQVAIRSVKISILYLWFFSGIQKAAHGYFLSGESFLFSIARPDNRMNLLLRPPTQILSALFDDVVETPDLLGADCFSVLETSYPSWLFVTFQVIGLLVILGEIVLPLVALRFTGGALALVLMQLLIAVGSGEWDFAFTGFACLALFFPKYSRSAHKVLIVGYILFIISLIQ